MSNIKEKFNSLSTSKKVQLVTAMLLTLSLIVSVPVLAWFSYQRKIVKLQKIQSPNTLVLSAAHREDSVNFEINGINADEIALDGNRNPILENNKNKKITHKDYVFCVSGSAVDKFTIQLAYTTNNPFTYEIYAADESMDEPPQVAGEEVSYIAYTVKDDPAEGIPTLEGPVYNLTATKDTVLYYTIDKDCAGTTNGKYEGTYLNRTFDADGHENATNKYHLETYEANAPYTNVQTDAEPVYWQAANVQSFPGKINSNKESFSRNFILRVKWKEGDLDNTTKETDIIYITVKATS